MFVYIVTSRILIAETLGVSPGISGDGPCRPPVVEDYFFGLCAVQLFVSDLDSTLSSSVEIPVSQQCKQVCVDCLHALADLIDRCDRFHSVDMLL
jgi:hypothetical protein